MKNTTIKNCFKSGAKLQFFIALMLIFIFLLLVFLVFNISAKNETNNVIKSPIKLLFLGDSLTEGYGLSNTDAYPYLVQTYFGNEHVRVINSGISGNTSHDVLNRLDYNLNHYKPNIIFLCVGANDAFQQFKLEDTFNTIDTIIQEIKHKRINILLAGVTLPKHFSQHYQDGFNKMYRQLAKKNDVLFLPSLLDGVSGISDLNLSDGLHPNKKGHDIISKTVIKFLLETNTINNELNQ